MRLKHFLFFTTLFCALAEIGMAVYAMHWGEVIKHMAWYNQPAPESELIVIKALNYALPLGVCCIALLLWTWRVDSIGGFAIFLAVVLHLIGLDLGVRAVGKVYGSGTSLAQVTWWAPTENSMLGSLLYGRDSS
jgi:hypothetical protein